MDVITLTGNLLAEWTFTTGPWQPGATHRASSMEFQVGGKGINVSRILERFDLSTEAIGFAGGPMADLCSEWLEARNIRHYFFPLATGVRPGLVIRGPEVPETGETTFLGQDLAITEASWKAAIRHVEQNNPRWLAICGSFPGWRAAWTEDIQNLINSGAARICADTYGPPLADLVRLPIDLVKINRVELERLFPDIKDQPTPAMLTSARSASPVRNWIITDGPRPVIAAIESDGLFAIEPAAIEEISPTGSGDTFLAALLKQLIMGTRYEEALRYAGACATANAASPGIGDFPLPVPDCYRPTVRPMRDTSS